MNEDERHTQDLVEQMCGPLDEILALYKDGLRSEHALALAACRDTLERILVELDADGTR